MVAARAFALTEHEHIGRRSGEPELEPAARVAVRDVSGHRDVRMRLDGLNRNIRQGLPVEVAHDAVDLEASAGEPDHQALLTGQLDHANTGAGGSGRRSGDAVASGGRSGR